MGKQCDFCFQFKDPLVPVLPKMPTLVCKACGYKIQQTIGFLQYHHATISYQPPLVNETPPTPPTEKEEAGKPSEQKLGGRSNPKHPKPSYK